MDKEFTERDLKLKTPCGGMIGGPSQTGKSTLVKQFFQHAEDIFDPPPKTKIYAYGIWDDRIRDLQRMGVTVVAGLPSDDLLNKAEKPIFLVLDDLMTTAKSKYLDEMYTKTAHHRNIAVFFVSQNIFDKEFRVARKNSQYLFLLRMPNDEKSVRTIGTHLFPGRLGYFMDAYQKATETPYKYLMIDLHPSTPNVLRLRSDILSDEPTVYLPKSV